MQIIGNLKEKAAFKTIKSYTQLTLGALSTALALNWFLTQNNLAPGGASGLGTVLFKSIGIPVSVTVLAVNIVLLIAGFKLMGKAVLFKTVIATVLMSAFIQMFSHISTLSDDLILSAVVGGALLGLGTGLTVAAGGSTGGTDLAAILLSKVFGGVSIAKLILIVDSFVILLSGLVFGDYEIMLYSALSLFIATKVADNIIEGVNFAVMLYIISNKGSEIAKEIIVNMRHGVTSIKGTGEYTGNSYPVLMCAIRKNEFVHLKKIVKSIDENAFIILTDARSVYGKGFN